MNKKLILILLAMVLVVSSAFFLVSCGEEVNIDHIEIYSMPKTQYSLGEQLDISNASILVVYKNNTEKLVDVTSSMLSGFDSSVLGVQYIKVYYESHSTVFTVTVSRAAVSHVELVIPDANLNYIEGQLLRTDDTYMLVTFADGSTERIDVTRDMCTGFDPNKLGSQVISVKGYLDGVEYTSSFAVTVTERELIGIEVTTAPTKAIYYVGDSDLDLSGGVLFLKYNSGYSTYIDMTDVEGKPIEGLEASWDSSVVNNRTPVTVSYGYNTTTFQVQVKVRDVSSYEILTPVAEQMQNLELDLTGAVIRINYNNGESEDVSLTSDKVRVVGYDKTKAGTQQVSLVFSYGGVELSSQGIMDISVAEREAIGLEMVNAPKIYQDTEFDVTEFSVRIVYNNGERGEEFNLNSGMIVWENNVPLTSYATAGEKSWYINYRTGVELDYVFNVEALRVTDIELHNANDVIAFLGGSADTSDVLMTVTYNSGLVRENVALDPDMVSFDGTTMGLKLAKITYTDRYESGFETDLYVTVVKEIASITVGGSYRNVYIIGEQFTAAGMELEVSYVGEGSTVTVSESDVDFYDSWSFRTDNALAGLLFNEVGTQTVYIVNAGLKEDYPITVTVKNDFIELGPIYHVVEGVYNEVQNLGSVVQGTAIDLSSYYILVTFEGTSEYVQLTQAMLSYNPKNTAVGDRQVTVYYPDLASYAGDVGRTFETYVTVIEKSVVGVKMLSAPDRKIYYRSDSTSGAVTEYQGIALSLEYDNGTYSAIDIENAIANSRLYFSNIEVSEIGIFDISYTYVHTNDMSYTGSFEIEVVDSTPVSISWSVGTVPEVEVTIGTKFNPIGLGYIENGLPYSLSDRNIDILSSGSNVPNPKTVEEIIDFITIEGYNANQTGVQDVRLVYGGNPDLYVTVKVTVRERKLEELRLINDGTELSVIQGAPIDLSLLSLQLLFNDGAVSQIPMDAAYINRTDANEGGYDVNNATIGKREVTISYTYANESAPVTLTVEFNVLEKSLVKIEINDIPKQYYIELEPFDISAGSIMLYYDNGTTTVEYLSLAAINSSTASFNIDNSRFDNSEFSGFSKVQRIYIRYANCNTSYNIYMRDRRNVSPDYAESNIYTFTYGQAVAPTVALNGYLSYGDDDREYTFTSDEYTVEYIPQEIWLNEGREEGADYTDFPTTVGVYNVVISYAGDGIHNAFEDASKLLTINKKVIYVGFAAASKIYGTANPTVYLTMSDNMDNVSLNPLSLFQYDDGFRSPAFNPDYNTTYGTYAYLIDANGSLVTDEDGNQIAIDIFNIVYLDSKGNLTEVGDGTAAGRYTLHIENQFVSPNYQLNYKDSELIITPREVVITPSSVSYTYGTELIPVIPYTASPVKGKEMESGLYGSDTLGGSLSRETLSLNGVGNYLVTAGSLQAYNPNYKIVFENDATSDSAAYVTILPRKIYAKTDSILKTYGEAFEAPEVKFFSDPACTLEDNAFASGDSLQTLGSITFPGTINEYTPAGNYSLSCVLDMSGEGAANYEVIYVSGYVEVSKRPVSVVAHATSKTYGDVDPLIGYDVGMIEGEPASGLIELADGSIEVLDGVLSRVSGENYGDYTIQIGTLSNPNYEITFTSNQFSILRKALYAYIAEENLTKLYDGRTPSISDYVLYEGREEGASVYAGEDIKELITFGFEGASKNYGAYRVNVSVNSNNYSIALYDEAGYFYNIERRVVAITASEYFDLPDNLEYKGEAYYFYAQIKPEDLQHQYNADGSYATDDNNKPLYDDPSVTLSISSATAAGSYTVSVVELADKNYELDTELSKPVTFTILPRTVYVVIKTNAEDNTIEREFNNQSAYISAGDYTLENLINEDDIPYFSFGIYAGNNIVTATDVLYAEDDSIVGYDIRIAENSIDDNYVVALKEEYKYKIVPKGVVIRIYDKYLTKPYDGTEPQISTSMFAPVSAVTGFDSNSVSFDFIREGNDGRSNASVGSYSVVVSCTDRNFSVTTQQPNYVYQITSANVSVSINSSAMEKAYDGEEFAFEYDDLTFTAYYGNKTIVHNFRYGDEYDTFVAQLAEVKSRISALESKLALVDFTEVSYAKTNIKESITAALSLENLLGSVNNPMQAENTSTITSAVETIIINLNTADTALENNDKLTAEASYNVCLNHIASIKNTYDLEESYVAFIFGTEADNTPVEVGSHPFEVKFSDYNRTFTLLNTNLNVSISTHTLYINVDDIELTYGEELGDIEFELYDPRTGEIFDKNKYIIKGNPHLEENVVVKNVGRYSVLVDGMYISEDGVTQSTNYVLIGGSVGEIIVNKAILSLKIEDVYDPEVFVYGKTVESSQLSGKYSYIQYDLIPENSSNPAEIKLVEAANAWAEANGYADYEHIEKMKLYYGGLQHDDELESILRTTAVKYNCYINGESGAQIFDTTLFDAGDYVLGATGFKADNYTVRVMSGVLTVAKRELTVYTQNGYYEKEYGESSIKYIYTGFAGQDNANTVSVYVDNDGVMGAEYSSLENMAWAYSYPDEQAFDPLDPYAEVTGIKLQISPTTFGYLMKNYTVSFGEDLGVMITKAPLYCTLKPVDGSVISSLYMATPAADTYTFDYQGFKNEDNVESLITDSPSINFKNGNNYFAAGVHTLGQSYLDASAISLTNYYIVVEDFQYEVRARKVYVSLENVDAAMTSGINSFQLTPYIAEVTVNSSTSLVTSANIISGQYGYTNFVFEIEGDDVNDEIRAAFAGVSITRYLSTDSQAVFDKNEDGTSYKEIYRYSEMYKHNIGGTIDHDTSTATVKLSNMSMNTTNFKFEYLPFEVKVYSTIYAVIAEANEKFVVKNGEAPTADYVNGLIDFSVITSALRQTKLTVADMLASGTIDVSGTVPSAAGVSALITYTLSDGAYNYKLGDTFTDVYYTDYYSGTTAGQSVSVTDGRVKRYDYSAVGSCTLPIRFYAQSTSVINNPALTGATYKSEESAESLKTVTASSNSVFNAMRLEIAIRPNSGVKMPSLEIGFNGTADSKRLSLLFGYAAGNSVSVITRNGEGTIEATATYSLAYGNLFDGNMHDIRVYLDKENLALIIYVDGTSGALLDLKSVMDASGNAALTSPEELVESTSLSLTLGGDFIIRSITLSEQGLYDGVGAHIRLPIESSSVLRVDTLLDSFTATVSSLNALFGLVNMDDSYSATYFINGTPMAYEESSSVKLGSGVHFVELALYKEGVLVDYDYIYVAVERNSASYVVNPNTEEATEIIPGTKLNFYTVSSDYQAAEGVDGSLVASSAVSEYSYAIGSARQIKFGSAYPAQYFNMAFALEPSATFANASATYVAGTYTTTIELFNNQSTTKVVDAYSISDTTYQGAALRFIRTQRSDLAFGSTNEAYGYDIVLVYYINGNYQEVTVASGVTDTAYEITVYKDRNNSYYGNNGIIFNLRSLYGSVNVSYDFGASGLNATEADVMILTYGQGDRMTIYNADYEENVKAFRDYLVDGAYQASAGAARLGSGKSMTLVGNAGNELYSHYTSLVLNFTVGADYTQTAGDVVRINLADSKSDFSGNGAYLEYDLSANALRFVFYYDGIIKSLSQVFALSGEVNGAHSVSVKFNKSLVAATANVYVGGDADNLNLAYNGVNITNTGGSVVHYTSVEVTMDGESTTFYMPLYNDMGLWIMDNGSTYGQSNAYSGVNGLTDTPTFLALYNYTSVVAPASTGITVEGYMVTNGECNSFLAPSVTEEPII